MQSYGDFQQIPRKISDSSPTCMDKRPIFGQIAEKGQKVVQRDTVKGSFCVNLRHSRDVFVYLTVGLRLRWRKKDLVARKKQATPAALTRTTVQKAAP